MTGILMYNINMLNEIMFQAQNTLQRDRCVTKPLIDFTLTC